MKLAERFAMPVLTSLESRLRQRRLWSSQKPALAVMDVRLAGEGDGIHSALRSSASSESAASFYGAVI
jgi:hypothetical protein